MLKFALIEENQSTVLYEYHPEGGTEFGVISLDKKTGECHIETEAENDIYKRYAMKLIKRIREMYNNKSFEKEGMIAWY